MDGFINLLLALLILFVVWALYKVIQNEMRVHQQGQKEKQKQQKRLDDEFLYDPETGAKVTLEEAESGNWIAHDNENRWIPDEELEQYFTEEEVEIQQAKNHLKKKQFEAIELDEDESAVLFELKMLDKYCDWNYPYAYKISNRAYLFIIKVLYDGGDDPQLLLWVKLNEEHGHHYLSKETFMDRIADAIDNDDLIVLKGYEPTTFKPSPNPILTNKTVEPLAEMKNKEIELFQQHLFIKTRRILKVEDIDKMLMLSEKFS